MDITNKFTAIGDAIRFQQNTTKKYTLAEMPTAIATMPGVSLNGLTPYFENTLTAVTEEDFGTATDIPQEMFVGQTRLQRVVIPARITAVRGSSFANCSGLTSVIFKGTPSEGVWSSAFNGTSSSLQIYVPWAEGAVPYAPWGATNATIHYNYGGEN